MIYLEHSYIAGTNVFSGDSTSPCTTKGAKRPTEITETITLEEQNSLRQDNRQTVREIASQNNIGIATAHKILTENLNMTRVSERWVPRLLTEDDQKR